MIQAVTSFINRIAPPYGTPDDAGPTGVAAVAQALAEKRGLEGEEFTATLGEPDVGSIGGDFISAPQIEIPVHDVPAGRGGSLAFDVENFENLMDTLDIVDPSEFVGLEVPISYSNGEVHIRWQDLKERESDEAGAASDDQDSESDESSSVTVTETDVTAASSDSNSEDDA